MTWVHDPRPSEAAVAAAESRPRGLRKDYGSGFYGGFEFVF